MLRSYINIYVSKIEHMTNDDINQTIPEFIDSASSDRGLLQQVPREHKPSKKNKKSKSKKAKKSKHKKSDKDT